MRDLSVQASNAGGINADAKSAIQSEMGQLESELNRHNSTTTFNGKKRLDGACTNKFQVGANSDETISVSIGSANNGMDVTGLGVTGVDVTSAGLCDNDAAAIKKVSTTRADLGAIQDRFDHTVNNLDVAVENLTASESRIREPTWGRRWSSSPGTRSCPRPAPRCSRRPTRPRRASCRCSADRADQLSTW